MNKAYTVVGLMSGTSLDGLDLACCRFSQAAKWEYEILAAACLPYPALWHEKLTNAFTQTRAEIDKLDVEYGIFLGNAVNQFMQQHHIKPDLIASHGHTVFHRPEAGFTLQIGSGAAIAQRTGIPVVNDFRQDDVKLGGQGAPLVPVGDRLLFSDHGICLNIGGIANISFEEEGKRKAWDVCPANQALNFLANKVGKAYDENGTIAEDGELVVSLLHALNSLEFYHKPGPKSLGREWVEEVFLPIFEKLSLPVSHLMCTMCEHISMQIGRATQHVKPTRMLVTGGGALNAFLVNRIRENSRHQLILPEPLLIHFKEALVFAFLGLLHMQGQINCYASVTGASRDSSAGKLHLPEAAGEMLK